MVDGQPVDAREILHQISSMHVGARCGQIGAQIARADDAPGENVAIRVERQRGVRP